MTSLSRLGFLVGGCICLLGAANDLQRPNFSGEWVLEAATSLGGRSAAGTGDASRLPHPIRSTTISGAAFNCGSRCRIVQQQQVLTIAESILGDSATPAVAVALQLDGRQRLVVDSFNPGSMIPVTAKWSDKQLEIVSAAGTHGYTQVVSLQGDHLVIVTSSGRDDDPPVTFTYKRLRRSMAR